MKPKRYTEEQIIYALKQVEAGAKVAEITRSLGVSEQTFYTWKKKYAGLRSPTAPSAPSARGTTRRLLGAENLSR